MSEPGTHVMTATGAEVLTDKYLREVTQLTLESTSGPYLLKVIVTLKGQRPVLVGGRYRVRLEADTERTERSEPA